MQESLIRELNEIMNIRVSLIKGINSLMEFEEKYEELKKREQDFITPLPSDNRYVQGLNYLKQESNRIKKEIKKANRANLHENVSLLTLRLNIVREKTRKSLFMKKISSCPDY